MDKLLEQLPKTIDLWGGNAGLAVRYSCEHQKWVAGYGISKRLLLLNKVKKGFAGYGDTPKAAVLSLIENQKNHAKEYEKSLREARLKIS